MSKIAIEGNASGTGTLTIAAPNTNSNFTLTIPDATTTIVGTDATQTLTNKTLTTPTLTTPNIDSAQVDTVSGTAPLYFTRAWVNFNGTGTVAIRASGNVSTVADNGTGDYTVNFTTAMPDANYAYSIYGGISGSTFYLSAMVTKTTSALRLLGFSNDLGSVATDSAEVNVAIFR